MMQRFNTVTINGKDIQLDKHCDEEFVIVDGVLLAYNGLSQKVVIPNSVTKIYLFAFSGAKIKSIVIPDTVKEISGKAFVGCEKLESVTIPEGIEIVENSTFLRCWNLREVNLPNSVTVIDDGAFWECRNLESLILPNNLSKIGKDAFLGCFKLSELILPETVKEIGDNCFENCENLKRIVLPERIKKIGNTKIYKTTKKYVRIDGKEICYLPTSKQYAKQFDKKVDIKKYETDFADIKPMPTTDKEVDKMTRLLVCRLLKILTLMDQKLWLDYARFADEKSLKYVFNKMDKLSKPQTNKKRDKENKILLMNMRGALMLNESELAQKFLKNRCYRSIY